MANVFLRLRPTERSLLNIEKKKQKSLSLKLFLAHMILRSIATDSEQVRGLLSSWGAPNAKTEAFDVPLSHTEGRAGQRGDHCMIRALKYTCMLFFLTKVKEIWNYYGAGWGGLAALENLSWSNTQLKCWVYRLLHRNHRLCTAEHNNRDWLCVAGQLNNCTLFQCLGRMYVDILSFLWEKLQLPNHHPPVTWGEEERGLHSSEMFQAVSQWEMRKRCDLSCHNSPCSGTVYYYNNHNGWNLSTAVNKQALNGFSLCRSRHMRADRSGKQMMALLQTHEGSTNYSRMRLSE